MFNHNRSIGTQHHIYNYDTDKHAFLQYFLDLYGTDTLDMIHNQSETYNDVSNNICDKLSDVETDLHKRFYKDIKTNPRFKSLYCGFIQSIFDRFFPDENIYIYQSFPSIRIQYFNSVTIPPHYDSDDIGRHPDGEKNFLIPITRMYGSNTIFIETEPRKEDYVGVEMEHGELFMFNGNKCTHYNTRNIEKNVRISMDFRILLLSDYVKYVNNNNPTYTNPREPIRNPVKMLSGGYYQIQHKGSNLCEHWVHNTDLILQTRPSFDMNEANACYAYMSNGDNFVTEYKQTELLEKMICDFIGCKHCVMTTSGTAALILSLMALGIQPGDEVIVPNYTMIATINAVKCVGATPVIIDVDSDSLTMNSKDMRLYITSKTKAVIHVSLNNRICDIEELQKLCDSNQIHLVEDAAQSLGCVYNNKHIGRFGKIGCFSLSTPKIISTGQGGFVITDDSEIYKKLCMIKNFGRKEGGIDDFGIYGLNFKFTDIQAVIGIEQMKKLEYRVGRMREIYDVYYRELSGAVKMLKPAFDGWIPWFIDIYIDNRDELMAYLKKHNIQTRKTYPEINKTPMYSDDESKNLPNSKYVSEYGLFLPSHIQLTDDKIIYICNIIKSLMEYNKKQTDAKFARTIQELFDTNSERQIVCGLTCYSNDEKTSDFYIKNRNTGLGNILFQVASTISYAIQNNAALHVPALSTYLRLENLDKKDTIFRNITNTDPTDIQCEFNPSNQIQQILSHPFINNMYFQHYYEDFSNFDEHKQLIQHLFSPTDSDKAYIYGKYPEVAQANICSIHVRLGPDFIQLFSHRIDEWFNGYFKCIDYMIQHKQVNTFFVLTDNHEYCKSIFNTSDKYADIKFIYSSDRDFIDIWIMSLIKNNIVSASTLAWWGSYMNQNIDRHIVCCRGNRDDLHYKDWVVL